MTDCATIPRWCLPIAVPDAEWEFEVAFSAGPSPDFTATVLAGAYYMDGSGDSSDLIAVTEAALNAADGDGTWTVERDEERIRFARNGQVGDVLSFGWPSPDVAQIYGYDIDPLEVVTNDGDYEQKGLFRARYCWTPDELLEEDDVTPLAEAVGAITPDGDAIVDGLGERGIMNHMIRLVPAALVKQSYTNQLGYANYVGDTEHGHPVSLADPNAALQKFWTFCRVLAGPIPPVIRYAADRDTPSSFVKCMWPEVEFLSDFDGVASIDTRQPLTYQIKIRGQLTSDEVVRPSGAWSDVCDSGGGGEPTEYPTFGDAFRGVSSPQDEVSVSWVEGLGVAAGNYTGRIQHDDGSFNLAALKDYVRIGTIDSSLGGSSLLQVYSGIGASAFTFNADGSVSMNATRVNLSSSGAIWNGYAYNELGIYLDVPTNDIEAIGIIGTAFESVQAGRPRRVGLLMYAGGASFGVSGGDNGGTALSLTSKAIPNSFGSNTNYTVDDIGGSGDFMLESSINVGRGGISGYGAYNRKVGAIFTGGGSTLNNAQGDPETEYFGGLTPYRLYVALWSNESVDQPWDFTIKALRVSTFGGGLS